MPGETVSFQGVWWYVRELHVVTLSNTGTHFDLIEAPLRPKPIGTFDRSADPKWKVEDVVDLSDGRRAVVVDSTLTTGRIVYIGLEVPPADPPVTARFA